MNDFEKNLIQFTGDQTLRSQKLETVQLNLGLRCNLACNHCHVAASPDRRESMSWPIMEQALDLVDRAGCRLVDLTGGAPELNPHFKRLIDALRERGLRVRVRTNLTIHLEAEMVGLVGFLRDRRVALVGSLPCYLERNVDAQRGAGTHERAIAALARLNRHGYGIEPDLPLDLVYNPGGPFLPPAQQKLEADYRRELKNRHGVFFSHLLTITNMPIGRFRADLRRLGGEAAYWSLLDQSFNPDTLAGLMCRSQISVAWDGRLYDCDFNLALNRPVEPAGGDHVAGCDPGCLANRPVVTGNHCLACTAGSGSSCAGALVMTETQGGARAVGGRMSAPPS